MHSPTKVILAFLGLIALVRSAAVPADTTLSLVTEARLRFGQIRLVSATERDDARARLGRQLFWDDQLSSTRSVSCASCHTAADHAADRRARSVDAHGRETPRNAQTVFNATLQPRLRWLADRKDAIELSEGLLIGPMGFREKWEVLPRLLEQGYESAFRQAFPEEAAPVTVRNYAKALDAYLATLRTPSQFDRYLAGSESALTAQQQAGLKTFIEVGCAGCHDGALLGGTRSSRFGLNTGYWQETRSSRIDPGQMASTQQDADAYRFRVAMLRNIARTGPYFHDGSVADLDTAIRVMGRLQLGKTLTDAQVSDLRAFLESLSGDVPEHYSPPPPARSVMRFGDLG